MTFIFRLILLCIALSHSAFSKDIYEVHTPAEAVISFQNLWKASLANELKDSSHFSQLKTQTFESGRIGARLVSAWDAYKVILNTLSPSEKKTLIIYGKTETLETDSKVWEVVNPGDIGNGFKAYLSTDTGRLLFWVFPRLEEKS